MVSAREYGLARTTGTFLAINHAEPLTSLGRWDEAAEAVERALELAPPPLHRASLNVLAGLIAAARGDAAAAGRWADAARDTFRAARYKDQHHLPLGQLEIETRIAVGDPAGAVAAARHVMDAHDVAGSTTRYGWQVLTAGARACVLALRQAAATRDETLRADAVALLDRLRDCAAPFGVYGRVQEGQRRTFAALDRQAAFELAGPGAARPRASTTRRAPAPALAREPRRRAGSALDAWDEAAAAWEVVRQPYPQAQALTGAAGAALAAGDREGAALRLRRAATLADSVGAAPLSAEIARLFRRARPGPAPAEAGRGHRRQRRHRCGGGSAVRPDRA